MQGVQVCSDQNLTKCWELICKWLDLSTLYMLSMVNSRFHSLLFVELYNRLHSGLLFPLFSVFRNEKTLSELKKVGSDIRRRYEESEVREDGSHCFSFPYSIEWTSVDAYHFMRSNTIGCGTVDNEDNIALVLRYLTVCGTAIMNLTSHLVAITDKTIKWHLDERFFKSSELKDAIIYTFDCFLEKDRYSRICKYMSSLYYFTGIDFPGRDRHSSNARDEAFACWYMLDANSVRDDKWRNYSYVRKTVCSMLRRFIEGKTGEFYRSFCVLECILNNRYKSNAMYKRRTRCYVHLRLPAGTFITCTLDNTKVCNEHDSRSCFCEKGDTTRCIQIRWHISLKSAPNSGTCVMLDSTGTLYGRRIQDSRLVIVAAAALREIQGNTEKFMREQTSYFGKCIMCDVYPTCHSSDDLNYLAFFGLNKKCLGIAKEQRILSSEDRLIELAEAILLEEGEELPNLWHPVLKKRKIQS